MLERNKSVLSFPLIIVVATINSIYLVVLHLSKEEEKLEYVKFFFFVFHDTSHIEGERYSNTRPRVQSNCI